MVVLWIWTSLEDANIEPGKWSLAQDPSGGIAYVLSDVFNPNGISGSYTVRYTLDTAPGGNCPEYSEQTIVVQTPPSAGTGNTVTQCDTSTQVIGLANLLGGQVDSGAWELDPVSLVPTDGFDDITGEFSTLDNPAGDYVFLYIVPATSVCEADTAFVTITVEECGCQNPAIPVPSGDVFIIICQGESNVQAFEVETVSGTIVQWYDTPGGTLLETGTSFVAPKSGTYYAQAFNDPMDECSSEYLEFELVIQALPQADIDLSASDICIGDELSLEALNGPGTAVYTWDFDGLGTVEGLNSSMTFNQSGMQTVTLTVDENGCVNTFRADVMVSDIEMVSITPDQSIKIGSEIMLEAEASSLLNGAIIYEWEGLTGESPLVSPTEQTTYVVTATDEAGCSVTDEVTIDIILENTVIIPNAFSPNEDGINDIFKVEGLNITNIEMGIYNRWGNEVFRLVSSDNAQGWDGRWKDGKAPVGLYVFYVQVTFEDGEIELLKGNVSLIR